MTYNTIIKALDNEIHLVEYVDGFSADNVSLELLKNVLDLITRQKAEIERLQKTQDDIDNFARDLCEERVLKGKAIADFEDLQEYIRKEKSEAIREFADKLKTYIVGNCCVTDDDVDKIYKEINRLVKEMTEGENG